MARNTTQETQEARPDRRFAILIADDDKNARDTLRDIVEAQGFPTIGAASGEEAVEIVRVELIHLVFLDMHMPGMTGLEALEQVRFLNALLPAILVTADATMELMRRALQAQVYSVIPKPVTKSVVTHTLNRALVQVYGPEQTP